MELNGLKVNFIGDSITYGSGATTRENGFVSVFGRKTGCVARNYGIGGTRVSRQRKPSVHPEWDSCFLDRVEKMDADADVVVVFGGTNDFGHGDAPLGTMSETDEYTFYGAYKSLMDRLIERFPAARIVLMTPTHRLSEAKIMSEAGLRRDPLVKYVQAVREIGDYYSAPVLDLWACSGIQPLNPILKEKYTKDGLHPNDAGHERIADLLIAFLGTI